MENEFELRGAKTPDCKDEFKYYKVRELIDNVTGIHYIVFLDNNRDTSAITPRYNSDGTIMSDKRRRNKN